MFPRGGTVTGVRHQRVSATGSLTTTAVMASSSAARAAATASKVVKPILSRDVNEAKRRARELYRAWYREIPNTGT